MNVKHALVQSHETNPQLKIMTSIHRMAVTNGSKLEVARLGNTKAGAEVWICIWNSIATNTKEEMERRNRGAKQKTRTGRQDR